MIFLLEHKSDEQGLSVIFFFFYSCAHVSLLDLIKQNQFLY